MFLKYVLESSMIQLLTGYNIEFFTEFLQWYIINMISYIDVLFAMKILKLYKM